MRVVRGWYPAADCMNIQGTFQQLWTWALPREDVEGSVKSCTWIEAPRSYPSAFAIAVPERLASRP